MNDDVERIDADPFRVPIPGAEGWRLVTLLGGRHHGERFWSRYPPDEFRVTEDGPNYIRARASLSVWAVEGYDADVPEADAEPDQLSL